MKEKLKKIFIDTFGIDPELMVRAPGRINLIGEHTDYNNGFVMPAAVDKEIVFAMTKSTTGKSTIYSVDFDEKYEFELENIQPLGAGVWQNYMIGVAAEIMKTGRKIGNFQLSFSGNVPKGSGMSSSAALECGTCFGLNELFGLNIPKIDMVKISQKAEHHYAGVQCGIMDQFASMMGAKDQAICLDCQSLEYKYFPIDLKDHNLVLFNSNVSHSLAESQYNIRRQECNEGVRILQTKYPVVDSLRNVTMEQLTAVKKDLSDTVFKRCKYVIEENDRVIHFTRALSLNAIDVAANILKEAQKAMQHEYEITCPEIDFMADFANNSLLVAGARMMGGGFGGCTINLIKKGSEDQFITELREAYFAKFGKETTPIAVNIQDGVSLIS